MAIQHEVQVYVIPRGRAYFDIEGPDGKMTGEIPFGNVPDLSITIKTDKADHYSSMRALREKDASIVVQVDRTGKLVCDNMAASNFALWLSGTQETITQTAAAVVDELRTVVKGRYYQLGASTANPLGVRNVTAITVKSVDGLTTYVAGTDYNVDLETGRVMILAGGTIVAGDVHFGYTPVATTYTRVKTGTGSQIRGSLRIVSDNATGGNRDYFMPLVTLSSDGDLPIIAEKADFVQMSFSLEVLKPTNAEAIYCDNRPVA